MNKITGYGMYAKLRRSDFDIDKKNGKATGTKKEWLKANTKKVKKEWRDMEDDEKSAFNDMAKEETTRMTLHRNNRPAEPEVIIVDDEETQIAQSRSAFFNTRLEINRIPSIIPIAQSSRTARTQQEIARTTSIIPIAQSSRTVPTNSSAKPEINDESICCICFDKPREYAFVPCGHRCCCKTCADLLISDANSFCPICRDRPQSVVKIYL